jgi:hypothetical protein
MTNTSSRFEIVKSFGIFMVQVLTKVLIKNLDISIVTGLNNSGLFPNIFD